MIRSCPVCKTEYEVDPKRLKHGRQTTCSRECSYKRRAALLAERSASKLCSCGTEISAKRKYCSNECRVRYRNPNKNKNTHRIPPRKYTCFYCGELFETRTIRRKNRIFCDRQCYEMQKSIDVSGSGNWMFGKSPIVKTPSWRQGWHNIGQQRIFVRSSWELAVAHWLERKGKDWRYEYNRYALSNGKTYVPDFFLMDDDTIVKIIEVKGWLKPKDKAKIALFREEYDISLEVWSRKKLKYLNLLDGNSYGKTN